MCENCGSDGRIEAVCAACGAVEDAGPSMVEALERLMELNWVMVDCPENDMGLLVCPSCVQRISKRMAMMANAGLN
jgi:hypothetical protein